MAAPLLIAIVFAAVFIPAHRAARLDPMKVLRHA
jgi:ABC-type antimicrobial peptide transport system permease subunit